MTYQANSGTEQNQENVIAMPKVFFDKFGVRVEDFEKRANLVPKHFKGNIRGVMQFEGLISQMAKRVCGTCDVALWDFAESADAKALMMYPATDNSFKVANHNNYTESNVDSLTFGVMVNIMTFSHASFYYEKIDSHLSQAFAEQYYALKDAFYSTVDALIYEPDSTATEEEKEQVRAMSSAVWSFLD